MTSLSWQEAKVIRIIDETKQTRRFRLKLTGQERFDFKPGQFVTLDLPIGEKPGKRWRSYSIASWPDESNEIELLIVLLEGGAGSTFLFNDIREGSCVKLRGPQGVFTLDPVIKTDLYFICTGTGIAPFRSMLHHIKNHKIPHRKIFLVFGTRTSADLLYFDELKSLEKEIDNFYYLPTLSRETWEGCCGYVHAVYEDMVKQNLQDGQLPPSKFYLCGWKDMITEAKQRILALGFDKRSIVQEVYG